MKLHDKLFSSVSISGTLVMDTALHVGGAGRTEGRDAPIIRTLFDQPFIPGSSLKGAFRARVENLAHLFPNRGSVPVCYSERLTEGECLSTQKKGPERIQEQVKDASADLSKFLQDNLCPVCRLFGGAGWRSRLAFNDLYLADDLRVPIERRDCVGIDRDTRTGADTAKFGLETVPAASRFHLSLTAENPDPLERAFLAMGLLEMVHGHLSLGGKTSRGLGSCRLDLETLVIEDTDLTAPQGLLSYLCGERQTERDPMAWLTSQVEKGLEVVSC